MSKPIVYGVGLSPFVRKVRVALVEKGIDYTLEPVMPGMGPDGYLEKSPLGKVPCYEEGAFVLPDSSVILAYLERKQPTPSLYPSDPQPFARALWYEEYGDTKLMEVCAAPFFQRIVRPMMGEQTDEAAVKRTLEEDAPAVFGYLERELEGREYLAGGQFSVADIATASPFANMQHGGETIDRAKYPKLADYVANIHARPSFKALIEEEKAALPS